MQIDYIACPENIQEKLETKHNVEVREAREVLLGKHRIRFGEKDYTEGEDVYGAFGQTFEGRHLAVFFVYKPATKTAIIISARDMTKKERKTYAKK